MNLPVEKLSGGGGVCRSQISLCCHDLCDCGGSSRAVGLSGGPQMTPDPVCGPVVPLPASCTSAGLGECTLRIPRTVETGLRGNIRRVILQTVIRQLIPYIEKREVIS
jgi:hypothetical protein